MRNLFDGKLGGEEGLKCMKVLWCGVEWLGGRSGNGVYRYLWVMVDAEWADFVIGEIGRVEVDSCLSEKICDCKPLDLRSNRRLALFNRFA